MYPRIALLVTLAVFAGLAADGATAEVLSVEVIPAASADDGDTCDGWPTVVQKLLDACPHGPTP